MRKLAPLLIAVLVLIGLIRLFQTVRQYDPSIQARAASRDAGLGDISVQFGPSEVISRSEGRRAWSVKADEIDIRSLIGGDLDQFRAAAFHNIHDGVLYRDGRPEAAFAAQSASFEEAVQRFTINGQIRVATARGDRLSADQLIWTRQDDYVRFPHGARGTIGGARVDAPALLYAPRKRLLQCPQGAEIAFKDYAFSGHAAALFWDVAAQHVDMPGPVSGIRKGMRVAAARATLDLKRHEIHANDGSVALRIEGEGPNLENLP